METNRVKQNDFSQGSISKNITSLAAPLMVAQLVNILYSMVDRVFIGHLPEIGSDALTGIGISMPLISIILGFASLCGTGGAPLCSIRRGQGDLESGERIMGNAFTMVLFFAVVVTTITMLFRRPILFAFGASGNTISYAVRYLTIYLIGTPFVMISLGMNFFINCQGFAKTGMWTVTIGAILNVILDPIFIFGLKMDVEGAALATILSQFVSAVWVLLFLTGKKAILRLRVSNMKPDFSLMKQIFLLGLSGFFVSLTNSVVQIVCNKTTQIWGGDTYVAAMTIINSIREMVFMVIRGFTQGFQPVAGFNYGARLYSRVRKAIDFTAVASVSYSALILAIAMAFPGTLFRIFTDDPAVISAGIPAIRIYFSMFLFMSLQAVGQDSYNALNMPKHSIFFSLFRKVVINAPLTVLLPHWFGLGVTGVFIAEAVSQFVGGLANYATMYTTVYRKLKRTPDGAPSPITGG